MPAYSRATPTSNQTYAVFLAAAYSAIRLVSVVCWTWWCAFVPSRRSVNGLEVGLGWFVQFKILGIYELYIIDVLLGI